LFWIIGVYLTSCDQKRKPACALAGQTGLCYLTLAEPKRTAGVAIFQVDCAFAGIAAAFLNAAFSDRSR
jgi:hypothetical protein